MNKRVTKMILLTLFLILSIKTTSTPQTNSLFMLTPTNEEKLIYKGSFFNPYLGSGELRRVSVVSKEYEIIKLRFEFDRNKYVLEDVKNGVTDTYTFTYPRNCTILPTYDNATYNNDTTTNTVTLTYNHSTNKTVTINMNCYAVDIIDGDYMRVNIDLNETVTKGMETEEFLYMDFEYSENYKLFLKEIGKVVYPITSTISYNKPLTPNEEDPINMYDDFIGWLEANTNPDNDIAKRYVKTVFTKEEDLFDSTKKLQGITVTCTKDTRKKCTFAIDKNIVGYARTYEEDKSLRKVYFSTTTKANVDEAFAYYLKYFYPDNPSNPTDTTNSEIREKIIAYTELKGSLTKLMTGEVKKIYGFRYNDATKALTIDADILRIIAMIDKPYEENIDFTQKESKITTAMRNFIETTGVLSDEYFEYLRNTALYDEMKESIWKNDSNDPNVGDFNDFYLLFDDMGTDSEGNKIEKYVVVNIFSEYGTDNTKSYNTIIMNELVIPTNVNVTFGANRDINNLVPITMVSNSIADINTAVDVLNTYFGKDLVKITEDSLIVPDDDGNYTVEFTVTKEGTPVRLTSGN